MLALIVDDMEENIYMLDVLLKNSGYQTITAKNGEEALEKLKDNNVDVIISDILMPVMDGFTFCKKVKTDSRLKNIPFIFYTATYTAAQDEELGLKMGADKFIRKPCEPSELIGCVKGVISNKPSSSVETVTIPDNGEILKLYNERLIKKLEKKMLELEKEASQRKSAQERYKSLYNIITDAVLVTDKHRLIKDLNDCALELFGYEENELKDKSISVIYKNYDDFSMIGEFLKTTPYKKPNMYEIVFLKKDGSEFTGEVSIYPLKNDKEVEGFIGIVKDITERKNFEKHLFQTQKMESLGRFASTIAHDFNNIITVISNYAEFIMELSDSDPSAIKYLKDILTSCERASKLTRELLVFSRGASGNFTEVDLNKTLEEFKPVLMMSLGKDIILDFNTPDETLIIKGDVTQIQQVVMNLVTNAKDALPETGGKIEVSLNRKFLDEEFCHSFPEIIPGKYAVIEVKDNGSGIDTETIKHIFEPFFTTKPAQKGTGLGLSICYRIIKEHKGIINLKSSKGEGTVFEVYLPAIQ